MVNHLHRYKSQWVRKAKEKAPVLYGFEGLANEDRIARVEELLRNDSYICHESLRSVIQPSYASRLMI